MKLVKALAVGAILAAGVAYAQEEPTDPNAVARSELMKMVGMNTGILGNMAGGKEPYDAAKAEGAKAALIEAAGKIEATFMEQGAADPVSEARDLDELG
jgi:cytochrome c556